MADEAAASHEEADKHKNLSITVVSCHCCIAPVCLFNLVVHLSSINKRARAQSKSETKIV